LEEKHESDGVDFHEGIAMLAFHEGSASPLSFNLN